MTLQEILKLPRPQLSRPEIRRRLSRALRCRECKGECKGCVIEAKRGKG